ncbi:MAG: chorismate mutase, partial [Myxococcales bacterium]|nr:chorismate mutase [Myxococcales bacterium]
MTNEADELRRRREELDALDHDLLDLLAKRIDAIREIVSEKKANKALPIRDEQREREIFDRWANAASQRNLSPYFVGRILREILTYSRHYQESVLRPGPAGNEDSSQPLKVAYQGIRGSYSDQAVRKLFPEDADHVIDPIGFPSFTAAVDALERGEVDFALLPIENSIAGSINETYELLLHRNVPIVGEEILKIEHRLLGLPGASIHDLKRVLSHPVALVQCSRFLSSLPSTIAEGHEDTAAAAEEVARSGDRSIAAIASEAAARAYGLEILREDIADQSENYTRFVLVSTKPAVADRRLPCKTSLVLRTNHEKGALVHCLQTLVEHDINMSKL